MAVLDQIVNKVIELVGNVSPTNGYTFNFSESVYYWKDAPQNKSKAPFVEIRDTEIEGLEGQETRREVRIEVTVNTLGANANTAARSAANEILTEIEKIEREDYVIGARLDMVENDAFTDDNYTFQIMLPVMIEYYSGRWQI